jgi:hypothetical protein
MRKVLLPLLIFLIFPIFNASASIFDDNFDSYNLGNINNQDNWISLNDNCYVSHAQYQSGTKSLSVLGNDFYCLKTSETSSGSGTTSFYFWLGDYASYGSGNLAYVLRDTNGDNRIVITFQYNPTPDKYEVYLGTYLYNSDVSNENWNFMQVYYDVSTHKWTAKLNNDDISPEQDWISGIGTNIKSIQISGITPESISYIDTFGDEIVPIGCILYIDETICEQSGCYWCEIDDNYSCDYAPFGDSCKNPNEGDITFTSFIDYYNEHADLENFPTPSSLITSLSAFIETIIDGVSGFLVNFQYNFDLAKAQSNGEEIGQIIPTARGYLIPINDFFGGFPLTDLFIFCILILVVVILFRGITRIWTAIRG